MMTAPVCPTCQGRNRETIGQVCMTCGRDYLDDDPAPGLGWRRLLGEWREEGWRLRARLAEVEAERDALGEELAQTDRREQQQRVRAEVAEARLAEVEPVVAAGKAWVSALDSMAPNEGVHPYALALVDAIRAAARGEGDR